MMKRWLSVLLACLLACSALVGFGGAESTFAPIDSTVEGINRTGVLILKIKATEALSLGLEYGDIIRATLDGKTFDAPVCADYSDVDKGANLVRLEINAEKGDDNFMLGINYGNLATELGIAQKIETEEEPGYKWEYREDLTLPVAVHIEMLEKGGYAIEYMIRHLERTNERDDYADLSDEEYANFRAIETAGMGKGALYRSSGPFDPELNRNREADAAIEAHGIRTIVNLRDTDAEMRAFETFADSNAAKRDLIALNLGIDFGADENKQRVAEGIRFMLGHEGPYLIHCKEGKDRTGFVSMLLEALMGADIAEIEADYMQTYINYYRVTPNTEKYNAILRANLWAMMRDVLGIEDAHAQDVDLAARAKAYLADCGLTEDEIAALKAALGKDY